MIVDFKYIVDRLIWNVDYDVFEIKFKDILGCRNVFYDLMMLVSLFDLVVVSWYLMVCCKLN